MIDRNIERRILSPARQAAYLDKAISKYNAVHKEDVIWKEKKKEKNDHVVAPVTASTFFFSSARGY